MKVLGGPLEVCFPRQLHLPFAVRPSDSSSSTQTPQCQMSKGPRTVGKVRAVIADQGEVKVTSKADQGFCEVHLSWLVTKASP